MIDREQFETLVADALDGSPAGLGRQIENVVVLVEGTAKSSSLFGSTRESL